ncbi:sodium-independent sulfate anion transporter-like [Spodoptera litura]|uniref:Sodium-independent sulfate anion transporter-like n=1 Tax=Spodoptera litura TaxID=69820 RepID=A0A9J7EHT0_SPOLT|nr:sodium-independent sulfate anion transporter-like [Spodoptera litura]
MDADDPRRPLLGNAQATSRLRRVASKLCSTESWKRRLPITIWLPKYSFEYLLRDAIAGITVGLTSIPQGIAYAMVAGLPPQVGLYSSIFPGLMYMLFGSCKDVTVGPTAILAALLAKYVAKSADFAYLAAFLSGCFILLLGILQLGFLLDFISKPVISGFTTAAALQISASQLKSLFRISGSSGNTFFDALINFFENIKTVQLWDTVLGISTIIALLLLKRATIKVSDTATPCSTRMAACWLNVVRARNALVVFAAAILAFVLNLKGITPFALTGTIQGGLPKFGPPPFSTVVNNQTLNFEDMLTVFGGEGIVMPLVAILESIAIAKAFGKELELCVYVVTVVTGAACGLEYGILGGAAADAARALARAARPPIQGATFKVGNQDCVSVSLPDCLSYASAEHVQHKVRRLVPPAAAVVVVDARHLYAMDLGVAENLVSVIVDLEKGGHRFLLWNFRRSHQLLMEDLHTGFEARFVDGPSIDQHILIGNGQADFKTNISRL